jgi:hypothetical protein
MRFLDLKHLRLVSLFTIMVLMISACAGIFPTAQANPVEPASSVENKVADESAEMPASDDVSAEVVAVESSPEPVQVDTSPAPEETEEEMSEQEMSPTEVPPEEMEQEPQVVVREQLVATDPATVSLASGQVQLVEFFAYW